MSSLSSDSAVPPVALVDLTALERIHLIGLLIAALRPYLQPKPTAATSSNVQPEPPAELPDVLINIISRAFNLGPTQARSIWTIARHDVWNIRLDKRSPGGCGPFTDEAVGFIVRFQDECQRREFSPLDGVALQEEQDKGQRITCSRFVAFLVSFRNELLLHGLPRSGYECTINTPPLRLPEHVIQLMGFVFKLGRTVLEVLWGIVRWSVWRVDTSLKHGWPASEWANSEKVRMWVFRQIGHCGGDKELGTLTFSLSSSKLFAISKGPCSPSLFNDRVRNFSRAHALSTGRLLHAMRPPLHRILSYTVVASNEACRNTTCPRHHSQLYWSVLGPELLSRSVTSPCIHNLKT